MQMTLLFPRGRRINAVLLAANDDRMRLAIPNRKDTMELRLTGNQWISEEGEPVKIEAVAALDGAAPYRALPSPPPVRSRVRAA